MSANLSISLSLAPSTPVKTVADLCRQIEITEGTPTDTVIVFQVWGDKVASVGVEPVL